MGEGELAHGSHGENTRRTAAARGGALRGRAGGGTRPGPGHRDRGPGRLLFSTSAGPHQKQVEKFLKRPVDGKQSAADCKAIQKFQKTHGITPTIGYAGPLTWRTMNTMLAQKAAGKNPNNAMRRPGAGSPPERVNSQLVHIPCEPLHDFRPLD
ncbi:hypothetical protein SMICM17S_12339 [Streptomyces microflavus]